MENVNFVKNIDNLGRIVIPMDVRRKMRISTGDVLSITCDGKEISLAKYNSLHDNSKVIEIVRSFISTLSLKMILMSNERIIYSNVCKNGLPLENNLSDKVREGVNIKYDEDGLLIGETNINHTYSMVPIVTNEGIIGSVVVFGNEESKAYEYCQLISKILMLELNIS